MLIAAFAAFALSAGFTVTGALLGVAGAPAYAYAHAPAAYAPRRVCAAGDAAAPPP